MRRAHTIIELTIVLLIMGILAGVAVPRMRGATENAADNDVRQSLARVRAAIELYYAKYQAFPGADGNQATLKSDLLPMLPKFPKLTAGRTEALDAEVVMDPANGATAGELTPTEGWRYYFKNGAFIVNYKKIVASDPSKFYDEL